ncbi:platelet glycoprotein 4-like [Oppia nitens]|uniref:platelet glycoprotein 4-like n=1 Tax=Oppia nitens TaxID=1686743 RepID=UPI0023DC1AF5|nr:platelet glycoprotein 4-like [Oppia nitens]
MGQIINGSLVIVGLLLIIVGGVILGIFPTILKQKVSEEMAILKDTDAFDRWKETPVPVYMKYNFFILDNSDNYNSLNDIVLKEKGPYVYKETRIKQNISISLDWEHISYREKKTYEFVPEKSCQKCKEEDYVNVINFPLLGILFNEKFKTFRTTINDTYTKAAKNNTLKPYELEIFLNESVQNILFKGVHYNLMDELNNNLLIPFKLPLLDPNYRINDNYTVLEEEWTINTGKNDLKKLAQIERFDYKTSLINDDMKTYIWNSNPEDVLDSEDCNKLRGTDAELFKPFIDKDDVLYVYEPQICRTVYFKYWKESSVQDIDTYRFRIPQEYYASPLKVKGNMCYCIKERKDNKECDRSCTLDISRCWRRSIGAPIIMSAPYWVNGLHNGEDLRKQVGNKGLTSKLEYNDENFDTYLDIEPLTGITMAAHKRMQMSIEVKGTDSIPLLKKLFDSKANQSYIIPVFWIEEVAEADESQADKFKSMVTNKKKLAIGLSIAAIVLGVILLIIAIVLMYRQRRTGKKIV